MSEIDDARRTLSKAEDVLRACERYFARQAAMNAQAHMSDRVMHSPIHGAIESVLYAIETFRAAHPPTPHPDTDRPTPKP